MSSMNLLLLLDRPREPIFTPKGDEQKIIQVPHEYLTEDNRELLFAYSETIPAAADIPNKITVKPVVNPGLSLPESLAKEDKFSVFIPLHSEMAAQVIEYLLGIPDMDDFWAAAVYFRAKLNPELFNYALSVVVLHKSETQNEELYSLSEMFPDKFFEGDVLYRAVEEVQVVRSPGRKLVIDIKRDNTGTDLDVEHRLGYFREDIGLNLHHWHWHLVYPPGPVVVAKKDRRGELFYYMHQQVIARYNMERFCNHLPRVKRLLNLRDPIPEGYFSKLSTKQASRNWPGRGPNCFLQDVSRPKEGLFFDVQDLERWRNRIYDAIHQGYIIINNKGETLELTEKDGINILGNLVESTELSKNRVYYGNLHNMMHVILASIHDPDFRHLEPFGVLGDEATAMRDPVFYRIHGMVDAIFQTYKATLKGYPVNELDFSGVTVKNVSVTVQGKTENQLFTFWEKSTVSLTRGLDFTERVPVSARFIHLQHKPFTYSVTVENSKSELKGTVRIFIAPKYDERGLTMLFNDQRKFFVELDRFAVDIDKGEQTIKRSSANSSVTIPFDQIFRDPEKKLSASGKKLEKSEFCGCGWPHNLLIAKGTTSGFPCQLFVMISNFADDKVDQEIPPSACKAAMSYCGIRNKKYPDARPMGFPFDRNARDNVDTLESFLTPNMKVADVKIFHEDNEV